MLIKTVRKKLALLVSWLIKRVESIYRVGQQQRVAIVRAVLFVGHDFDCGRLNQQEI